MEQDEMKLAWRKLNETVGTHLFADRTTLAYILERRRKTALGKLLLADKIASLFFFLFAIALSCVLLSGDKGFLLLKIQAIGIVFVAAVFNLSSYRKLLKMRLDESVLMLHKKVSSYKKIVVWAYLITYVLVAVFLISFSLIYPLPYWVKVSIILLLPICVAIDYYLFHWSSNQISTLIDTSKELEDLNQSLL